MYSNIFNWCAKSLKNLAELINKVFPSSKMDYTKINVLIFCFLWPAITVAMGATIVAFILDPSLAYAVSIFLGF